MAGTITPADATQAVSGWKTKTGGFAVILAALGKLAALIAAGGLSLTDLLPVLLQLGAGLSVVGFADKVGKVVGVLAKLQGGQQ